MGSRSIICRRLRQIIDLCDKTRYFAITEFNKTLSNHRVCLSGQQSNLPFFCKSDRKKEKSMVSFTHKKNIICSQAQLDDIAHERTIICR